MTLLKIFNSKRTRRCPPLLFISVFFYVFQREMRELGKLEAKAFKALLEASESLLLWARARRMLAHRCSRHYCNVRCTRQPPAQKESGGWGLLVSVERFMCAA